MYGWRNMILRMMGATIGKSVKIYPSAKIMYPWLLHLDDQVTVSWNVNIYNLGKITIGKFSMISQHSHLCGGTHDHVSGKFELLRTGLTIGNNVWVAADAFIGPGVRVADNVIVAARGVVVTDVSEGSVVGGNPARVIGKLDKPYNHRMENN
jgi:putative colanic acid biosynthesis acetyltransferase WcaF